MAKMDKTTQLIERNEMLNELARLYDSAAKQGWEDIAEAIAGAENTVISEINFEKRKGMKWHNIK